MPNFMPIGPTTAEMTQNHHENQLSLKFPEEFPAILKIAHFSFSGFW